MILAAALSLHLVAQHRSRAVTAAFQRVAPCPSTGRNYGPCPGWVRDHIVPLCAGGPDAVTNLAWQTVGDAKVKDRVERKQCRQLHVDSAGTSPWLANSLGSSQ